MKHYTVHQLANLSGVSVRTLHHYDEIGVLRPAFTGENRYRYYGREELLRLQQILFYRELGLPLLQVAALLDQPDFDRLAALRQHRDRLKSERERYRRLIETIDRTIVELSGEPMMNDADFYNGFAAEKQVGYERWLVERYGEPMQPAIDHSTPHLKSLQPTERQARMQELADIEAALVEAFKRGLACDSPALEPVLARHRSWVALMWNKPCSPEAFAGLADLYCAHPDFVARYEKLAAGFCDFLVAAMKAHARRLSSIEST